MGPGMVGGLLAHTGATASTAGILVERSSDVGEAPGSVGGAVVRDSDTGRQAILEKDIEDHANATTDPTGPTGGSRRVKRGGAYDSDAASLRAANRASDTPETRKQNTGFRVVRAL